MRKKRVPASPTLPSFKVWAVQFLSGAVLGTLFALGGAFIGSRLSGGSGSGFADLASALGGMLLGYPIGASVGVNVAGKRLGQRGNPLHTCVGSLLGSMGVLLVAEPLGLNQDSDLMMGAFASLTPLLATLGYHARIYLSRKPQPPSKR